MQIRKDLDKVRARIDEQKNYYIESCNVKSELVFSMNNRLRDALISICIPTYKRYNGVKKSIISAFRQRNFKLGYCVVIIDNDPSLEDTRLLDFLKNAEVPKNCKLLYFKNQKNVGMYGNWNKCIELAKTDFIGMLHDDDVLYDDYLIRITRILEKYKDKNVGYIRCNGDQFYAGINRNNHVIRNNLKKYFAAKLNKVSKIDCILSGSAGGLGSPTCGSIINRKALISVKGYNPELYPTSDCYPPYLMIDRYGVYTTISSFGAKYFGENESVKVETMRGWLREYLYFQQYLAAESKIARVFISFFGDQQYSDFINKYLKNLLEIGEKDFEHGMFDDIYAAKSNRIKGLILNLMKSCRLYYTYFRSFLVG